MDPAGDLPGTSLSDAPAAPALLGQSAPASESSTGLRYSVVVPVFNEADNIAAFCAAALKMLPPGYELLIVYDFDEDNTLPALAKIPADAKPPIVRPVRNTLGRGVRFAIEAGMRAAEADVILVTMADLSDDFTNVEEMLRRAKSGVDVVCASRYMSGGQQIGGPKIKKFLSRLAGFTLKWLTGLPTYDPTNSFKCYRRDFLERTVIESEAGFCLGLELTVKAHFLGGRVAEVPVVWQDRAAGTSRFKLMKWLPLYLRWYLWAFQARWLSAVFPPHVARIGEKVEPGPNIFRLFFWYSFLAINAVYLISMFVPWQGDFPGPVNHPGDLDGSWCMVLHWSWTHHIVFGKDIVFTYGPWGFIQEGYGTATYPYLVMGWLLVTAAFFAGTLKLSKQIGNNGWARAFWMILIAAFIGSTTVSVYDIRMFSTSALALLIYFFADDLGLSVTTVLLAAAMALASQVKFSSCVVSGSVLAAITADQLLRRKIPWAAISYAFFFMFFWLFAGQPVSGLPAYIKHSIAVAGGYAAGEGISIPTETSDVIWFCVCALPLLATAAYGIWRLGGKWTRYLTMPLALGMFLFVVFKAGYVRHDAHEVCGVVGLGVLGMAVAAATWKRMEKWPLKLLATCAFLAPMILTWCVYERWNNDGLPSEMATTVEQIPAQLETAIGWIGGSGYLDNKYSKLITAIRNQYDFPTPHGTVDMYGWYQSDALVNNMQYQPRPIFQSYLAYTPELERLNAASLDTRPPDSILLDVGSIDGHYPSLEDALVWPRILTHYDLKQADKAMLLLEKSPEERSFALNPISETDANFCDTIKVPDSSDPIWVKIDVKPTLAGKIGAALDKPPMLVIAARFHNGKTQMFRLIPSNAGEGFLLSPCITDRISFSMLQSTDWSTQLDQVKVTEIAVGCFSSDQTLIKSDAYQTQYHVTFQALHFPHRDISTVPGIAPILSFQNFLSSARVLHKGQNFNVLFVGNGRNILLAPPTSLVEIPVKAGATHLRVQFGILAQAYENLPAGTPPTDGAGFGVYGNPIIDDKGKISGPLIWSRVLKPADQPRDRNVQTADIDLGTNPPSSIMLATIPGAKGINPLSYWAAVDFH